MTLKPPTFRVTPLADGMIHICYEEEMRWSVLINNLWFERQNLPWVVKTSLKRGH